MIPTLAWKEYREQRGLWLAIALLAWLLTLNIALLARGGLEAAPNDAFVRQTIVGLLFALMVTQGVVCGAQLLAGERDAGTLAFLDALSSQRFLLWSTKLIVGSLLTVAQALVLYGLAVFLHMAGWVYFPSLAVVGLLGLIWGMVGGAVCEHVFPAILTGIVLTAANFGLLFFVPTGGQIALVNYLFIFLSSAMALGALAISKQKFCATDRDRLLHQHELYGHRRRRGPFGWQALLWLAERQGHWIVWPGLVLSFASGFVMHLAPDFLWPVVTLIIGLVCGSAVFAAEQPDAQERFLGGQRLPPGRIWLFKTVFWMLAATGMTALVGGAMLLQRDLAYDRSRRIFEGFFFRELLYRDQAPVLFLTMWVLYGFCFGQFCSLLSRRIVVATVLGTGTSLLVLAFWLPSLAFGGMRAWQILAVPLVLLVAVRLSMWLWFSGRLYTKRHVLGLSASLLLAAGWIGGNLWYRAVEIPDVGVPFDIKAFEAKLNLAAKSEAGALIRQGIGAMVQERLKVKAKLGPPTRLLFPLEKDATEVPGYLANGNYMDACWRILHQDGWPEQDGEISPWLDAMFAGDWVDTLQAAAKLPLGLVVDPRSLDWNAPERERLDNEKSSWYRDIGLLFSVRAAQLETRGDYAGALASLETLLGLYRQMRHCAPGVDDRWGAMGVGLEWQAVMGFDRWLYKLGPRPELLRNALKVLQHHEKESPDRLDTIKVDYYVRRNNPTSFFSSGHSRGEPVKAERLLLQKLSESPWERERQLRFLRAFYQARLRVTKLPGSRIWYPPWTMLALADGGWSAKRWEQLVSEFGPVTWPSLWPYEFSPYLPQIHARQVYIALMLYQSDEGRAADQLEDLVPRYLAALPLDPFANMPIFNYKVFADEKIEGDSIVIVHRGFFESKEQLLPGQGLLWLHLDGQTWNFPVPLWKKK